MHGDRLTFHHIGVACHPDALTHGAEREELDLLGYCLEGEEWADDRLGMRGQFMVAADAGAPRLELVVPYGDRSPVTSWLERELSFTTSPFWRRTYPLNSTVCANIVPN